MSSTVIHAGNTIPVSGHFPSLGDHAPAFTLVGKDLSNTTLETFVGKRKVLNIFPSVDGSETCKASVRTFNAALATLDNVVVLCISADLPFAQSRFCAAEDLTSVHMLSTMRSSDFSHDYGVAIADGPLVGLAARAVVVIDENNIVLHSELVAELGNDPNYAAALASL